MSSEPSSQKQDGAAAPAAVKGEWKVRSSNAVVFGVCES